MTGTNAGTNRVRLSPSFRPCWSASPGVHAGVVLGLKQTHYEHLLHSMQMASFVEISAGSP
jgi:hypothetical protein